MESLKTPNWNALEVGGRGLEDVGEDGGALEVDAVIGDGASDVVEGDLDGVGVLQGRHVQTDGGAVDLVVVVAEALAAECGRSALAAVGLDEVALWDSRISGHLLLAPF